MRLSIRLSNIHSEQNISRSETSGTVKANIFVKRNDTMMNIHNRLVAHNWRGNVDMQIILDQQAAINYMVKCH